MFKVGDVVYCIDEYKININVVNGLKLFKDRPYTITRLLSVGTNKQGALNIDGMKNYYFESNKFISEQKYLMSKRFDKILKLKECLRTVIV